MDESGFGRIGGKNRVNLLCGFVPSVLSRPTRHNPMCGNRLPESGACENERLFLISNPSPNACKGKTAGRKTKNRKHASKSGVFRHGGVEYEVNAKKSGIYTPILHKFLEQLEICEEKWRRVLVVRFDLHQDYWTDDSKHISKFRKNLNRRLEREYGISEMGYLWVREQERAKSQHYHFAIMLDGDKIRHSSKVLRIIKETWEKKPGRHVPTIRKPYYLVDSEEMKADAIYRISYLAKARGKGYRPAQNKDYSTSRLLKIPQK